jgi:hypothetical protein
MAPVAQHLLRRDTLLQLFEGADLNDLPVALQERTIVDDLELTVVFDTADQVLSTD